MRVKTTPLRSDYALEPMELSLFHMLVFVVADMMKLVSYLLMVLVFCGIIFLGCMVFGGRKIYLFFLCYATVIGF